MADVVRDRCSDLFAALAGCSNDRECAQAHIALTACIAQQVCRDEAKAFISCKTSDPEKASARYAEMEDCVTRWGAAAAAAEAGGSAAQ